MKWFTVIDPTTFTKPWTAETPMTRLDDALYDACHERNYALVNILRRARQTDQDVRGTEE